MRSRKSSKRGDCGSSAGTLIFDEFGRLKCHARNPIPDLVKDKEILINLWDSGLFDKNGTSALSELHLRLATALPTLAKKEPLVPSP
jgi:hypothetical protein